MKKLITIFGSLLFFSIFTFAASKSAGNADPFSLAVTALQDASHNTDVTIEISSILPEYNPPSQAKHIQLKSFDTLGELRWTKNVFDVPLNVTGNKASTTLTFTDISRYQPIAAQVQVQTSQTKNTKVLKSSAIIKFRPDLSVTDASFNAEVPVGAPVNIAATIAELNGDLGATADAKLSENGELLDDINDLVVNPGENIGAVFTTTFETVGTHELAISLENVEPGDFDNANNIFYLTIEVIDPETLNLVEYYMDYRNNNFNETNNWEAYWGFGNSQYQGFTENFYEYFYLPVDSLSFPVDNLTFEITSDGNLFDSFSLDDIPATYSYVDSCYNQSQSSFELSTGTWIYLGNYSDCWNGGYSYAQVQRYVYDYTYYSNYYDYYWGYYYYNYYYHYINSTDRINATDNIATTFTVTDGSETFGGNATVDVDWYDYSYSWDYYYWYYYNEHYWGNHQESGYAGYSYGTTTAP